MFYSPQHQQNTRHHRCSPTTTFANADIDVDGDTTLDLDLTLDDLDIDLDLHLDLGLGLNAVPHRGQPEQEKEQDRLLAAATPQSALGDLSMLTATDLMHPDSWLPSTGQFTPKSAGRASHHRESSLSSLGSAGPASPFSQNTSNPHIAVTDSLGDGYHHGLPQYYDDTPTLQMAKALHSSNHDVFYGNRAGYALDAAAPAGYAGLVKQRGDRGLLPPPELSIGSNRSRPVSVASSVAGESPATPSLEQPEEDRRRRSAFNSMVPKLDRTMTDVYGDELYSASFAMSSASPSQATQAPVSPGHDMFSQRLQAINSQHLNATHSPVSSSRGKSPFRHGSPLAPSMGHDFAGPGVGSTQMHFASARLLREQDKAEQDARAMREQMTQPSDTAAPQTISPKDAILEFRETEGEVNFPLFPQQNQVPFEGTQLDKAVSPVGNAYESMSLDNSGYHFMGGQLPVSLQVPQQYPFIAQPRQQMGTAPVSIPSRVSSAGSSSTDSALSSNLSRPTTTNADGGTYTCTYHGCTLRFETPALLQKHKREGHRQAHGLNGTRRVEGGVVSSTGAVLDTQAGPHRCDRINPSTGKPCSTIFSRPYDLTRHEDTIHNGRKQKVRCGLCTEEKTFSRADALTRHYRVCHPDVELPGKHRRRAVHSM